jgi:hypothetical protein
MQPNPNTSTDCADHTGLGRAQRWPLTGSDHPPQSQRCTLLRFSRIDLKVCLPDQPEFSKASI